MNIYKAKMQSELLNLALPQYKQLKIQNKKQLNEYKCKFIYKYRLLPPELGDNK